MDIKIQNLIKILVVLIYSNTGVTGKSCGYPSGQKWYVFGIYSACYNRTNRTELNRLAEDLDQTVGYMWRLKATDFYDKENTRNKIRINVTYISVDVCNDFQRVVEIVDKIQLDKEYYYATWSRRTRKFIHMSSVLRIYAELPTPMMGFLQAPFSLGDSRFTKTSQSLGMKGYLKVSFVGDTRFIGNSVSFNASFDSEMYKMYASILHYITDSRFKWERIVILNVLPSSMTPLYELLIQKMIESKVCVQYRQIQPQNWTLSNESYFTRHWFRENRPAVITMGDLHGQIEIIKQLSEYMEKDNYTIPILAEGFYNVHRNYRSKPSNFDCFKDVPSPLLTTQLLPFSSIDLRMYDNDQRFHHLSVKLNKTFKFIGQKAALLSSLALTFRLSRRERCYCKSNFHCVTRMINRNNWSLKRTLNQMFSPSTENYYAWVGKCTRGL